MPLFNFQSPDSMKDAGPAWESAVGIGGKRWTSGDQSASQAAVTDAPTAGQKLVVTDLILSVDTAMTVYFYEQDQADPLLMMFLPANGTVQVTPRGKLKLSAANKCLMVQTSAEGNIAVTALTTSES